MKLLSLNSTTSNLNITTLLFDYLKKAFAEVISGDAFLRLNKKPALKMTSQF